MITDINLRVSLDQDIGDVQATYVSTNSVDLNPNTIGSNQPPDFGEGFPVAAVFSITEAVVGTVSTITFQVITDSDPALATTPVVLATTIAIPEAQLVLGRSVVLLIPPDLQDSQGMVQRYLGTQYIVGVATTTAGTVTCDFVVDYQSGRRFYLSNFPV